MTDSIYIQLSDPWRQGVTITPKIARQIVAMGQPTNLEPVAPMSFANYPIKGWTDKPAAPADEDRLCPGIPFEDEPTVLKMIDVFAAAHNAYTKTYDGPMYKLLGSIRQGEAPGLTTTEQEKTRRQPLLDEIERLRAEMQQHREASARLIEVANDERDAAIARADAAERKLRDAYTQIREDPIDTNKVIEDLSSAVDRERAAHAEAMTTITDWIDTVEAGSIVTLSEMYAFREAQYAKYQNKDASK